MELQLATWTEVERSVAHQRGIILPIGSTEQHGPSGLIGTDALTAEGIARDVGRLALAYVTPTIAVGMAQHHLGFAGSITLRPGTLIAVIRDMVTSLARHGFTHFFFVNGHGGNIPTVLAAFDEILADFSLGPDRNEEAPQMLLTNWWDAPAAKKLIAEWFGEADGAHATASEISITQFLHPGAVPSLELSPRIAPPDSAFGDARDYRRKFPDGRIGSDPSLARAEYGEELVRVASEHLAAEFATFTGASAA